MRDIPGLNGALLKRATDRAAETPSFRFRGQTKPTDWEHTPVAYATPAKVTDGVAKLRLYDVIDSWGGPWGVSANEFVDALDALDEGVTEIRLHINSPGGEVWEGLAIMNALRQHDARVVAVVDGIAASAASFVAASADEVIMAPNTRLMIHDALGICIGQAQDMRDSAAFLDDVSNNIASIYAAKAGGTTGDWRSLMLAETWYSADEAVLAGLADQVAGEEPAGEPANNFDLKAVGARYKDRSEAPPPPAARAAVSPPVPVFDEDRKRHMAHMRAELNRRKPA